MNWHGLTRTGAAALAALTVCSGSGQVPETLEPQAVYNLCQSSVVRITIKDTNGYAFTGAGFFVNDDLHVVTSYHVVSGATEIKVEGTRGAAWNVVQVKINKASDLALLRLDKPSGRRPLPYGSLAGVHPGDRMVLIGDLLASVTADMATGTVDQVQMLDGQTVLALNDLSMSIPLGSPVVDVHGRVVGVERSPVQDGPERPVAVSVLGIGFLSGPIPWASYAKGVREVAAEAPIPKSGDKSAAGFAYEERLAHWLDGAFLALLRWDAAYLKLNAEPPPRDDASLDAPYQAFTAALQDGLDALTQADPEPPELGQANLAARVATLERVAKELEFAQKLGVRESQQADLQRAAVAAQRLGSAEKTFGLAGANLISELTDRKGFVLTSVAPDFSPPALGYIFCQHVFDALPDPDRNDAAVIGIASPTSDFRAGDVVEGVAPDAQSPFIRVRTWSDVAAYLFNNPKLNRVYVRVNRAGAHAMFFSRPAGGD